MWSNPAVSEYEERIGAVLSSIVKELSSGIQRFYSQLGSPPPVFGNLATGTAGIAVLFAYLSKSKSPCVSPSIALGYLDNAIAQIEEKPMPPALYGGYAGIAWATSRIASLLPGDAPSLQEDPCQYIDEHLLLLLKEGRLTNNYDLIAGLVGIGVYFLERHRAESPTSSEALSLVIDRLLTLSSEDKCGLTWFTPPLLLPPHQRLAFPRGYLNLGMAHGIPGIIAFLAKACKISPLREVTSRPLDAAVNWLRSKEMPPSFPSTFPTVIADGHSPKRPRLAWCYGDLGVASALMMAGQALDEPSWREQAISTAKRAALTSRDDSGVIDACLCHGAAGIAHLFSRFYNATGEDLFGQATAFWTRTTLAYCTPGHGAAGFVSYNIDETGRNQWATDPGFLNGVSGIALVLHGLVSTQEPDWDELLLVDIEPRRDLP